MSKLKVTEETKKLVIDLIERGMTVLEVAREIGVTQPTVYKIINEAGVEPQKKRDLIVDLQSLMEDYRDLSQSVPSICRKHGISTTMLYNYIAQCGVEPRTKTSTHKKVRSEQIDRALELYQTSNLTIHEIVAETGVSQPVIHQEIRERGIQYRQQSKAGARRNTITVNNPKEKDWLS
jgi:transposase-like protein